MSTTATAINFSIGAALGSSFRKVTTLASKDLNSLKAKFNKSADLKLVGDELLTQRSNILKTRRKEKAAQEELLRLENNERDLEVSLHSLRGKRDAQSIKESKDLRKNLSLIKNKKKETRAIIRESLKEEKSLDRKTQKFKKIGGDLNDITRQNQRINRSLEKQKKVIGHIETAEKNREKRNKRLATFAASTAATVAIGRSLNPAVKFDDATTRLRTVIDPSQLNKSREHALGFSRKSLSTQKEIIDIQYALNSAGIKGDAARFGSEIVSKVATVTAGQAEQVGEIVGTVFNNMGDSLVGTSKDKLTRIGDLLTQTQLQFQLRDFGQLGESFKTGSKAAIKYGIDLDETAATLGAFNSFGVQGSSAGTAFNAVLRQMSTASKNLGFEIARDTKGNIKFLDTLKNLDDVTRDMSAAQREDVFKKSFGDEGGAVVLLLKNMESLEQQFKTVKEASRGAVDKNYAYFLENTTGQIKTLGNAFSEVGIRIGSVMLPPLNAAMKVISWGVGVVASFAKQFPMLTGTVGLMALGVTSGIAVISGIGITIAAVNIGIASWNAQMLLSGGRLAFLTTASLKNVASIVLQKAAMIGSAVASGVLTAAQWTLTLALNATKISSWSNVAVLGVQKAAMIGSAVASGVLTAAQWALNVAMTANPIGLVIGGIALLGAGLVWAYKKFTFARAGVQHLWTALKYTPIGWAVAGIKLLGSGVKSLWGVIANSPIGTIVDGVKSLWGVIANSPIGTIVDGVKYLWKVSSPIFSKLGKVIKVMFLKPLGWAKKIFGWLGKKIVWLGKKLGIIKDTAADLPTSVDLPVQNSTPTSSGFGSPQSIIASALAKAEKAQKAMISQNTITVHALPGMNEADLAARIAEAIEQKDRESAARMRGLVADI